MEGRWTIRKWRGGSEVLGDMTTTYTATGDVQVVPCDDAAIARALAAVQEERRQTRGDVSMEELIEIAFRAAGETP